MLTHHFFPDFRQFYLFLLHFEAIYGKIMAKYWNINDNAG